ATLASAPVSADPVKNAVYRNDGSGTAPSSYYQEVRRRVFVAPAYAYDPYFDGRPITRRRSLTCGRSSTRRPSPPTTMAPRWITAITAPAQAWPSPVPASASPSATKIAGNSSIGCSQGHE